mmetsp:Transcript_22518/g.72810  ORF Transcript_22518/g.72810 Transcript_22518/m.72810 type:complete len:180 (-) Transcript_22518:206-745(-)
MIALTTVLSTMATPFMASPTALFKFLLGEWRLSKTLEYKRGGITGSFEGNAEFVPLADMPDNRCLVSFTESGCFIAADERSFETRNRLLYDFSDPTSVQVFFDECALPDGQRTAQAVLDGARYFHSITIPSLGMNEHPCGPDVYRGKIELLAPDEFEIVWRVSGPRKDGKIVSVFRKYP